MLDTTLLDGAEEEDLSLVRRELSLFTLNRYKVYSLTILMCPRTKLLPMVILLPYNLLSINPLPA